MNRLLWLLRGAELGAALGSRMLLGIFVWYLVKYESDARTASFVLASYYVAKFIAGIALSPLSDRFTPVRLFRACIAVTVLVSAGSLATSLSLSGLTIACMVLAGLLLAIPDALLSPAITSTITRVVPNHLMVAAFQHKFTVDALGGVVAIGLGIVSLDAAGLTVSLVISLSLCAGSLLLLSGISLPEQQGKREKNHYWRDITAGFEVIRRFRFEVWWNFLSALANLAVAPLIALVTPFMTRAYWGGEAWRLVLLELSITVGILLSAQIIYPALVRYGFRKIVLVRSAFFGMSLSLAAVWLSSNWWFWMLAYFSIGVLVIINNVCIESMRALAIPAEYRGRVQTIHHLCIQSAVPVGLLIGGAMLETGRVFGLLGLFVMMLTLSTLLLWYVPKLKELLATPTEKLDGVYEKLF